MEKALSQANKQRLLDNRGFSLLELEWFSRNSYNLALQSCASWPPDIVLRLLDVSMKVIWSIRAILWYENLSN